MAWILLHRSQNKQWVSYNSHYYDSPFYVDIYINKIPRELLETLSKKDNQQPSIIHLYNEGSTTIESVPTEKNSGK